MAGNKNMRLRAAYRAKRDEFYTQLPDIEREMRHYKSHFKNKVVFCNCDDPYESNFFKYFVLNFNRLGLKKLIATCYAGSPITGTQLSINDVLGTQGVLNTPYKAIVTTVYDKTGDGGVDMIDIAELFKSGENELTQLEGDGDFRSDECLALLDESDIVVTNPPFSLFRQYVDILMTHEKSFVIVGNQNAITYKEFFPLLQNNKVWIGGGFSGNVGFFQSPYEDTAVSSQHKDGLIRVSGVMWFTNLDLKKRHEELILVKKYQPELYPKYDNYDAIDVSRTADIPYDYSGVMGVPITFMDKYNPDQFEIIGMAHGNMGQALGVSANLTDEQCQDYYHRNKAFRKGFVCYTNDEGKLIVPYMRILIRNKHPEVE